MLRKIRTYIEAQGLLKKGDRVLVALYIDKSSRLCATMNVYKNLRADSPYRKDDRVKGRVYEISDNFGAFVAVDNCYSALIPKKELYGEVRIGEDVEARVVKVLEDGRLTLGIRENTVAQMEKDGEKRRGVSVGDGPIDAAFRAIEQVLGHHYELDDFQIQAVTEGREAMGSALVKLRADGRLYSGNGISTDIIGAAIRAYISALNKIVYEEG